MRLSPSPRQRPVIRAMTPLTKPRMTVDEFVAWATTQPGRYELFRGDDGSIALEPPGLELSVADIYAE